jgi:hypothetical protein
MAPADAWRTPRSGVFSGAAGLEGPFAFAKGCKDFGGGFVERFGD